MTGFLGPNGSGKSTTMRLILGLDGPSAGTVTVNGKAYGEYPGRCMRSAHCSRRARCTAGAPPTATCLSLAQTHGVPRSRVSEFIDRVGLHDVARKRVDGFSLGMGQRLGIAAALLADPQTVILDEPANGLDPEGLQWIRNLLKHLASDGRTVFASSHLMSEMALTSDHLIVIGRGHVIAGHNAAWTRQRTRRRVHRPATSEP